MLRKSLFLLFTVALVAGLMFAGCQQDVEYREVPGPTVTLPGNDTETTVPGPEKEVPVYVNADITVSNAAGLRAALLNPAYKVIAVVDPGTGQGITLGETGFDVRENLVIPPGKSLYLYASLTADAVTPPITIEVQGELVVGYGGTLSAGADHQVKVSGEGSIKVQDTGVLETDVPASVNDGAVTVLGTPQVLIDGYGKDYEDINGDGKAFIGATLRYTGAVLSVDWSLIETAFDSYITQGILDLSSAFFKPSDLVKLVAERPASVGKKAFRAKSLEPETVTALTIPVNAYISTDNDSFDDVETLTVRGHLDTGALATGVVFEDLTSLTIAGGGILATNADFDGVQVADMALGGSLINTGASFGSLPSLTVNGTMVLNSATFADLTDLNITAGSSLTTGGTATFPNLQSLTIGEGASFTAPGGIFPQLDDALTVNGTFTVLNGGALFTELNDLVVNGTLNVTGNAVFPAVSTLTVTGKGNLVLANGTGNQLGTLETLTVENGARITLNSSTTLNTVSDLTVRGVLNLSDAEWGDLRIVTVTETGEFTANNGNAAFDTVTDLTLNGTFTAENGTFDIIANVEGAGTLIAGDVVVTAPNKAKLLYDSPLTSVSLGTSTGDIFTEDVIVPAGRTRIFTAGAGDIAEKIYVEPGATLVFDYASAGPGGGGGDTIEVEGTLKFINSDAAPIVPINVKQGGALIFDGTGAVPGADITVNSGATLAFNGATAAPVENITVYGTLVVGHEADVSIAATKTLKVTGTLDAGDLTAQGFEFGSSSGETLTITGNYELGSTIEAKIGNTGTPTTLELVLSPNGYIRDLAAKSPWSLEGGNASGGNYGRLVLTGITNSTTITLGKGKIVTSGAPSLTEGKVTLNNGAYLVAKPHSVPSQTIGLTLDGIIIDLTEDTGTGAGGKIVIEPGAKLNLAASANNGINGAGIITTVNNDGTGVTGLIGSNVKPGNLTTNVGTLDTFKGVINGGAAGKTIDKGDTFAIGTPGSATVPAIINVAKN